MVHSSPELPSRSLAVTESERTRREGWGVGGKGVGGGCAHDSGGEHLALQTHVCTLLMTHVHACAHAVAQADTQRHSTSDTQVGAPHDRNARRAQERAQVHRHDAYIRKGAGGSLGELCCPITEAARTRATCCSGATSWVCASQSQQRSTRASEFESSCVCESVCVCVVCVLSAMW